MRITLTKQQALVAKCTDTKHYNQACHVARIGAGRIVSADGYQVARAPIDYDGEAVFVPTHMMPSGACDVDLDGESLSIITVDGTQETTHEAVKYSDVDATWAKLTKRKPKACVALNVALLRRMLRCVEAKDGGSDKGGIIRFYVRKPGDAVEWRVQDAEGKPIVEGLIMPMFVNWERGDATPEKKPDAKL